MTEKCCCCRALLLNPITDSVPYIPVLCQKLIELLNRLIIQFYRIRVSADIGLPPADRIQALPVLHEIGRHHVPHNSLFVFSIRNIRCWICFEEMGSFIQIHHRRKLSEPSQSPRCLSEFLQTVGSCILRSSKRGHIALAHIELRSILCQEGCFSAPLFRQCVMYIVRISMPDK